ncbi:hypothetical protein BDZ89DRAFT_1137932 [Hymenopellis radicata]|nr:hypothetical protein BDZ89DRAFT_1137932 [Hymenopellis radicata]
MQFDREEITDLLNWPILCGRTVRAADIPAAQSHFLAASSNIPPPPPSTLISGAASTLISQTRYIKSISEGTEALPRDAVLDLCDLHLRPDLILKNSVMLPGLAEFFAMLCDAELERNQILPDIDESHDYSRVQRSMDAAQLSNHQITTVNDVRVSCEHREGIAAGATAAFLNPSASAWDTPPCITWRSDPGPRDDGSAQSYLYIDTAQLEDLSKTRPHLAGGLQAAVEHIHTPFFLHYYTEPEFLTDEMVAAMESIFWTDEQVPWLRCTSNICGTSLCKEHFSDYDGSFSVGLEPGPDADDISRLISAIMAAQKATSSTPKKPSWERFTKLSTWEHSRQAAVDLRKKVWMKLVAIDGTYAIVSDGIREFLFVRHRKSQTLIASNALEITRNPDDRMTAPHMKVHIGATIAATLNFAGRGRLLQTKREQQSEQSDALGVLNAIMSSGNRPRHPVIHQIYEATSVWLSWPEEPSEFSTMIGDPYEVPDAALTINVKNPIPGLGIGPAIHVRVSPEMVRDKFDEFLEAKAWLRFDEEDEWIPMLAQFAKGAIDGKQLGVQYAHRVRLTWLGQSSITPEVYGVFGNVGAKHPIHVLFLQDIGISLRRYIRYATAGALEMQHERSVRLRSYIT